jgi:hypothetical protein
VLGEKLVYGVEARMVGGTAMHQKQRRPAGTPVAEDDAIAGGEAARFTHRRIWRIRALCHFDALSKVTSADMAQVQGLGAAFHPIGITYDRGTGRVWVACYGGEIEIFAEVAGVICPGVTAEPAGRGC